MKRFRTHWLALLGGALLLALSVSGALGAKPAGDDTNRGQQVSSFVHDLVFGTDEPEEEVDEEEVDEEEVDEEEQNEDGESENHGSCVAAVAHSTDTGGVNDNHGGAVSLAARFTCWGEEPPGDEPVDGEPVDEDASADDGDEDATTLAAKERGRSAAAHDKQKGRSGDHRGGGHGRGGRH